MNCALCPVACGADRELAAGACGVKGIKIAKYYLHPYEEPTISFKARFLLRLLIKVRILSELRAFEKLPRQGNYRLGACGNFQGVGGARGGQYQFGHAHALCG